MRRIDELQGLRSIALLLVVTFHLFANGRVSGGVDVFLVISGFVVTLALLGRAEGSGVDLRAHYRKTIIRLVPSALIVAVTTVIVGYYVLTSITFAQTLTEAMASVLYLQNFELINSQLEYEAAGPDTSPFQHFWSLAVQGQFIFVWPLIIAGVWWLAHHVGLNGRRVAIGVTLALMAGSAWVALVLVEADQPVAYFHTASRLWEILAGALLALVLPVLGDRVKAALSWIGLALIVSCGFVIDGATLFPGVWALWPVAGALCVLAGAGSTSRWSARSALEWGPLKKTADVSYELYLWHWPLMIYYLAVTGQPGLRLHDAAVIFGLSLALAWATHVAVRPIRIRPRRAVTVAVAAGVVVMATATVRADVVRTVDADFRALDEAVSLLSIDYPRAAEPTPDAVLEDLVPSLDIAWEGTAETNRRACYARSGSAEVQVCDIHSPEDPTLTVLLVGASHDYQFDPTFKYIAEQHDWELSTIGKPRCRFGDGRERDDDCVEWNVNLWDVIEDIDPDVVFTLGTFTRASGPESINPGSHEAWERLLSMGTTVITLRDNPRFDEIPADCIAAAGRTDAPECSVDRAEVYEPTSPGFDAPEGVIHVDTADLFCDEATCPAVIGEVLVYRDSHHLTATFARTLGPEIEELLIEAAPSLFEPEAA